MKRKGLEREPHFVLVRKGFRDLMSICCGGQGCVALFFSRKVDFKVYAREGRNGILRSEDIALFSHNPTHCQGNFP